MTDQAFERHFTVGEFTFSLKQVDEGDFGCPIELRDADDELMLVFEQHAYSDQWIVSDITGRVGYLICLNDSGYVYSRRPLMSHYPVGSFEIADAVEFVARHEIARYG